MLTKELTLVSEMFFFPLIIHVIVKLRKSSMPKICLQWLLDYGQLQGRSGHIIMCDACGRLC